MELVACKGLVVLFIIAFGFKTQGSLFTELYLAYVLLWTKKERGGEHRAVFI